MKKIYILLGLVALSTASCENYLDTEPIQKIAIEQYYTDETGITNALAGVYDPLGSEKLYGSQLWWQLDSSTDEGYYARAATLTGTMVYSFDASAVNVTDFWANLYDGINRANDLIAHVNLPKMDEDKRQQILGEALFLRGYYYFMLVSHFGDVPLRLTPTTSPNSVQMARTTSKEVYAQILKDMTEAEAKVSATKALYSSRVYKTVVQGVLARVCLQMAGYPLNDASKYADALAWSKKVIDSGQHSLNVSFETNPPAGKPANYYNVVNPSNGNTSNNAYRQIFITEASDKYDTNELMWEADFKARGGGYNEGGRVGNNIGIIFQPAATNPLFGTYCWGFIKGTGKLFRTYDATGADLRRDWNLTTYTVANATGVKTNLAKTIQYGRDCGKWRREYEINLSGDQNYTAINFPILRYSDVLLMYAEAENQVNGPTAAAQEAVNKVRRRGYGRTDVSSPYAISDAATATAAGSKAAFQQFIEDERMRELCFEGLRKMDLIRWNKFAATMKAVSDDMAAAPTTGPLTLGNQQYGALGGRNASAGGNKFLLFPIPSLEMSSNTLIPKESQNPGW
ncbi:MAG: RagB/SusD family nutrient uptake outer membrane protein [Flavobacterium sp.]|uniref:RagB/SusD family nutrient uptake outer membrane protein n=1 Tax=Flavobacterium sp. TaxID=239 RepID=UPI001AFD6D0A|nr:RagB/SusD family nutrient uptake outer membrane protein [Flavobacterium sp.]MBO9586232.1 RagB/SusD family nutrient uptake outer membrane protein [Flavobacterium sp.]